MVQEKRQKAWLSCRNENNNVVPFEGKRSDVWSEIKLRLGRVDS